MKRITVENYRQDTLYPRIVRATAEILGEGDTVAPVEVFIHMQLLSREDLERWRVGRVPYLEKLIRCNLSRCNRVLRILRMHAHDLNLVQRPATYRKWGKGTKPTLRFSKRGEHLLEEAYSRHYERIGRKRSDRACDRPANPRH